MTTDHRNAPTLSNMTSTGMPHDSSQSTGLPKPRIRTLLADYQQAKGLTDEHLAQQLGVGSAAVISQVLSGGMQMPLSMVTPIAQILEHDRLDLLSLWVREYQPLLLDLLNHYQSRTTVSDGEFRLLLHLRKQVAGRQLDPIVFDGAGVALVLSR